MPRYLVGDTIVRRKNLYMPCALGPRFEEASDEEQARIYKQTAWADLITNAEWAALLGEPGCSPSAKSRLKKKTAYWLMAIGRITILNPDLLLEAMAVARRLYLDQTGEPHPLLRDPADISAEVAS